VRILGVGVDVVEVARMARILERHPRFAGRHFAPDELAYCGAGAARAACFAARWAAKEAVAKSLGGVPAGRWREVMVVHEEDGRVRVSVEGRVQTRMREIGATELHLSLAHERAVAVATVVASGP
jgi:holo-[acyl-carrier protein] synthase